MVFLPTEILNAILDECDKLWIPWEGYQDRFRYTPLVTINRNWQAAVEERTWKHVKLVPDRGPRKLEAFRSALRADPRRRRVLKKVEIFFDDYFARPKVKKERERVCDDDDDYYEAEERGSIGGDYSDAHRQSDADHWQEPSALISAFQAQNRRFFQDVKAIWDILAEFPDDLQVTDITVFLDGHSTYGFFGSDFCITHADYFKDISLQLENVPILPPLPSVRSLKLDDLNFQECELWPAIVTCKVATFLPALEVLHIRGLDNELSTDTFSRTLHLASHNLTTLTIRLPCITTDLLWPEDTNAPAPNWPNLRILDITTAFDRPTSTWWFISEAAQGWETPTQVRTSPSSDWAGEYAELYRAAGVYPDDEFRTAPDPALFDDLALRLARAVSRMPVLMYLDLEFHSWRQISWHARQQDKGFEGYKGWGFYFRDGERAKGAVCKYTKHSIFQCLPGIDSSVVERARTEWVFKCRGSRVGWEEGEEAKKLWRARGVEDFDVITTDEEGQFWQRKRNGVLIDTSTVSDYSLLNDGEE
ncbi:hypothetical protein OPT61_g1330 [Boeremia exigua]|uniref:Uncharacterized protein n=1 Tax=Boeremia exigua TaxID=749465 RepID=A0ACC2IQQ3_9PLEO|nr:hypothetical protein OPT61_g1330 [Boeremia exigua]